MSFVTVVACLSGRAGCHTAAVSVPLVIFASGGGGGIALVVALAAYLVPSVVGFARHHHNKWAILALNVLLGWTILGWVGALVWALTRPSTPPGPR